MKKKYKQTDLGVILEDWEEKRLGDEFDLCYGKGLTANKIISGRFPVFGSNGIVGFHNQFLVKGPGIIIGRKGSAGEIRFSLDNFWPIDTTYFIKLKKNSNIYFFYYFLLTLKLNKTNSHSAVPGLNREHVYDIIKKIPGIPEQNAIANVLSDADALITSLEKLIAKKRNIKQGAMQELLTGKKRLPGFSGEWELKKLGDVSEIGRGRVISHKEINTSIQGKYPVYSSQTSNNGIMGYIDTFDFDGEYVTWTTDGVNAGTVFCRSGKFNCTNVCGAIKLKKDNPTFVATVLNTITPKHVSKNLANPKLMNDPMKKIEFALPSIEEQTAIAQVLNHMDAEIEALEQKLTKYRMIKQGMMQELLTGKTRLI